MSKSTRSGGPSLHHALDDLNRSLRHTVGAHGFRQSDDSTGSPCNSRRKIHSVTVVCDGLLVESEDGVGECDQGDACQALELRDDYPAYRAAHGRVIAREQAENREEYGGEG
jgi:hypothetical protein